MSTSIEKCILVEVIAMCEFHLKGNCFHPEKVSKGVVANTCDVHSCDHCTNKIWQTTMVNKDIDYHQLLLNLAMNPKEESTMMSEDKTKLDIQEENRFKSPFTRLMNRRSSTGKL